MFDKGTLHLTAVYDSAASRIAASVNNCRALNPKPSILNPKTLEYQIVFTSNIPTLSW